MEATEEDGMSNTHGAWLYGAEGEKDQRLAGGSEKHCQAVLEARGADLGYVRALTADELR